MAAGSNKKDQDHTFSYSFNSRLKNENCSPSNLWYECNSGLSGPTGPKIHKQHCIEKSHKDLIFGEQQ